uniref:Caprin-2 n=1 Tax=Callorhinchus milii TaxID=7868 RepID=A0A4W3GF13_CALMI|eukprot:gi/632961521/ref/XP_007896802.1/ PREDICTED: caprin-2 isoform X1 [Callorhinchus milii]
MVHLSLSPDLPWEEQVQEAERSSMRSGQSSPSPRLRDRERERERGSPSPSAAPTALSPYYLAYETYIDNGMICLKHKIRNIEKRKGKLDDYKTRLQRGEELNQDQLEAVHKYDEVVHNLEFAKELQKTFAVLNQDLLKVQRKSVKREQLLKTEAEKKRLCAVLHVRYILLHFSQEHVQKDFREGFNGALVLPRKEIGYLKEFCKIVYPERNQQISLEDQMDLVSCHLWDLLEGVEKTVAGTTYKQLKVVIKRLMVCSYFNSVPVPHNGLQEEEEEQLIRPLKVLTSTPKPPPMKESESDLHFLCSEMQPREFVNRQYANKVESAVKQPEKPKNWEADRKVSTLTESVKKRDAECGRMPEAELPKTWEAEHVFQKLEKPKKWEPELLNQRHQEEPKKWDVQYTILQEGPPPSAIVPKEVAEPKKSLTEPKEKWDRRSKHEPEAKQVTRATHQATAEFCSGSSLPKDPELRKQKLQDLMSQIQGTCNFMQDSMLDSLLESDVSLKDAVAAPKCAVLSLQGSEAPKEPKQQNKIDVVPSSPKPVDVETHTLSALADNSTSDDHVSSSGSVTDLSVKRIVQSNSESEACSPHQQMFPATSPKMEPSTSKPLETNRVSPTRNRTPSPTMPLTPKALDFQDPVCSPPANRKTTPFQSMHTVFNVNAPLPPRTDQEVTYNQSVTTSSTQTPPQSISLQSPFVEQNAIAQDTSTEETTISNGGHVYPPHGQVNQPYLRASQPYFGVRGAPRGVSRGSRGIPSAYRSPSNGYKGFDGYRAVQVTGNGIYGPLPNRDYPGIQYTQRESGYPNYKRVIAGGPRTARGGTNYSTGWSDSSQMSSPERDDETFASGDSGQGDSRSLTPVDLPVTSQTATILPVHVYPLPQQMRVAFSTARTSNFAPGSLDQPIVFDLLLNNLGETFDFQLGRFSCPVNGTYVFIFHMLKLAVNVPLYVNLMKNEEVLVSAYANDGAPDHETASNHAVLQLFRGDQIWLRLHRGAIYGSSWKYSTFSGYLLYQD